MDKIKIQIILGSTRQGREGDKVAKWLYAQLSKRTDMICESLDLRDYPLPFFDEPESPSHIKLEDYKSEVAKRWYKKISEGDGFIIISPEYNHGYPGVLKNALDYINKPWNKKPVAFVSYSDGLGAGIRVVEQLRQVVIDLEMVPIRQMIYLPSVDKIFNEDGAITDEVQNLKVSKMADALLWWAGWLRKARAET